MFLQETLRWYGPDDPVKLEYLRQAGAAGVVSALHHIPYGEVWPTAEILKRQEIIARAGLTWDVVESLPVHEDIKTRSGKYAQYIANYRQSMRNLASCGLKIIVYNFMPVLDWIRTDLHYRLDDGSEALHFNRRMFAAFDLFILNRPGAAATYSPATVAAASEYYSRLTPSQTQQLEQNISNNFPGFKGMTLNDIRAMLSRYALIDAATLREHLTQFLREITPLGEELGLRLAIHPDDPPFPILGLPRICSTQQDIDLLLQAVPSSANGICFCAGSFSGRPDNDVAAMFEHCAAHVAFLHLRSTQHDREGNFYEANHLEGSVNMYRLVKAAHNEQIRRRREGRSDWRLPFRPDHGHTMLDDLDKPPCPNPGYTAIGRLRGLAELRGLEYALLHTYHPEYLHRCPGYHFPSDNTPE
ncbi:MAG: mannonate dehydratase [Victivallales bacterium]|nr:mannonate dehydratase [Victivallales bacterium]